VDRTALSFAGFLLGRVGCMFVMWLGYVCGVYYVIGCLGLVWGAVRYGRGRDEAGVTRVYVFTAAVV